MNVFNVLALHNFEDRTARYLRTNYAEATAKMSDPELLHLITAGIDTARCYGLELEEHITAYLELALCYGADSAGGFNWAERILRNYRLTSEEKVQRMQDHCLFDAQVPT